MYILSNALKNLLRNKGRNILLAAVTLAIILSTVVTLTISNAAAKVIDDIRLDIGSRVEIGQDRMEMMAAGLDGRSDSSYISIDSFRSFAESEYLSRTIWNAEMYAWSGTFYAVDDPDKGTALRSDGQGGEVVNETMKLVATSEPATLTEFGNSRNIIEGRMFEEVNECVVSQDVARLNNTSVGDVIEVTGASFINDKAFSLTVVGIYSDETEAYLSPMLMFNGRFADSRRNEIITGWDTLMTVEWASNYGLKINPAYYLKNPDEIKLFEEEARSKGLPVTYNVGINQDAYDKVSGPLSSMNGAVTTFMIVILILGVIVLALLSFMAVRERKYEVGVLRAMGMEKSGVAFGILAEAVIIAAACLLIGLGAGGAMAQPIASGILEGNVAEQAVEDTGPSKFIFAGGEMQTDDKASGFEPESEIQVNLNADVLMQIILITLALAALSGVIGVVVITQYEPLKILRERN